MLQITNHFLSRIITIPSISYIDILLRDLHAQQRKNVLLIWDLDDVIFKNVQFIGRDLWFRHMLQVPNIAFADILNLYNDVQKVSKVMTLDPRIVKKMQYWRENFNVRNVALTSRNAEIKEATLRQLASLGIKFDMDLFHHKEHEFDNKLCFADGVIFCDGQHKGECLQRAMQKMHIDNIDAYIFSDDHIANVEKVVKILSDENKEVYGVNLNLAHAFDYPRLTTQYGELAELAKVQLAYHRANSGELLSDDAASVKKTP